LTTPKAVEKIHKQWEKTPYDFDMYLLNLPKANKPQFREVGEVSMDFIRNELKLTPEEFPDNNPNAITIIFNGNFGDQRYMASGWILAHRLGHAFARGRTGGETARLWIEFRNYLRKTVAEILKDVYNIDVTENSYDFKNNAQKDKILKYVAQQLGTMKSARDKNIRNWYEFAYELLAQYLITDKITFNELPKNIVTGIASFFIILVNSLELSLETVQASTVKVSVCSPSMGDSVGAICINVSVICVSVSKTSTTGGASLAFRLTISAEVVSISRGALSDAPSNGGIVFSVCISSEPSGMGSVKILSMDSRSSVD
jgi:hypothetical protein